MTDSRTDADRTVERAIDRADLARAFRSFAGALEDGTPVRIADEGGSVSAAVGRRVTLEAGIDRDVEGISGEDDGDSDPSTAGLTIDLEWDDPDGSSVRATSREGEDNGEGTDPDGRPTDVVLTPERPSDDASEDSAMATMPPEGVVRDRDASGWTADSTGGADRSDRTPRAAGDAADDEPDDRTDAGGRTSRFEVYEDRAGEWRWRLVHWNGNIVADSGEGYASRSNAERAVRSVKRIVPAANTVTVADDAE
ncbi:Uncharacterized conserved protein YegP, UPF0339 family [Halobiforma haloterrestris]|uniref:Uncharacterized conserved protein YegP, UPF0339 family n=1 Tax=Natronobacterium haloterrestre TaxID=148448 RepID=A0A1I1D0X2_NATHA|nr:DUF1508 domain-containing protein [Halobiforma haloterrestris]SFB68561.1 Uncharacterized conserved protein YegP, UPF0339 family [Halobiforma haloterrestris]